MGFFSHATEYIAIQIMPIKISNNVHFKGLSWRTQRYITQLNFRKKNFWKFNVILKLIFHSLLVIKLLNSFDHSNNFVNNANESCYFLSVNIIVWVCVCVGGQTDRHLYFYQVAINCKFLGFYSFARAIHSAQ